MCWLPCRLANPTIRSDTALRQRLRDAAALDVQFEGPHDFDLIEAALDAVP